MNVGCNVIQDLLPSYVDKFTSNDSNKLIENHLKDCDICRGIYHEMKQEIPFSQPVNSGLSDEKLVKKIKNRMFTIILTLAITFTLIGCILGVYGNVLFQEGNPIPVISSIIKLEFSDQEYTKVATSPTRYISKYKTTRERYKIVQKYMKNLGWKYKEQMGSALIFEKGEDQTVISIRQYTKNYYIWSVPNPHTQKTK